MARANPKTGDNSSDFPIVAACAQSTPLVPDRAFMTWFAIPTPIIDPIKVCELEAGNPNDQVPRFQRIAATSSANTIAKPAPLLSTSPHPENSRSQTTPPRYSAPSNGYK